MGAALYPVDPNRPEIEVTATRSKVAIFERPSEQSLNRAMGVITQLEAELGELVSEIRGLREVLARAEHRISCQEQLLRNAMVRERELRSQLAEKLG